MPVLIPSEKLETRYASSDGRQNIPSAGEKLMKTFRAFTLADATKYRNGTLLFHPMLFA